MQIRHDDDGIWADIFWDDLCPITQNILEVFIDGNGNYDVCQIASINLSNDDENNDNSKEKHFLICTFEDKDNGGVGTETLYFDDYYSAFFKMIEQIDETGNKNDHVVGDDYEIEKHTAWSNMNHHCPCAWRIEKIPK